MADTTNKQTKVSVRHIVRLGDHLFLGSYLFDSRDLQLNVPTIMSSSMTDPGFHHLDRLQNYCNCVHFKIRYRAHFQPLLPPPWQLLGANTATTGKKLVLLKSPGLYIASVLIQNCEEITFQVLASSGSLLILLYSDTNYALEVAHRYVSSLFSRC